MVMMTMKKKEGGELKASHLDVLTPVSKKPGVSSLDVVAPDFDNSREVRR
jgi:hypothetical protein